MIYHKTQPNHIYLIYLYKVDLTSNNLQWLLCHKIQTNQIICVHFSFLSFFLSRGITLWLNYHVQKIRRTPTHDIRKQWAAISTVLGLICRDLPSWSSNQRSQNAEPKLYHWANSPHHTQVMPNQLVIVIARLIYLNMSCKLHPYSLQRTRSLVGEIMVYTADKT